MGWDPLYILYWGSLKSSEFLSQKSEPAKQEVNLEVEPFTRAI